MTKSLGYVTARQVRLLESTDKSTDFVEVHKGLKGGRQHANWCVPFVSIISATANTSSLGSEEPIAIMVMFGCPQMCRPWKM